MEPANKGEDAAEAVTGVAGLFPTDPKGAGTCRWPLPAPVSAFVRLNGAIAAVPAFLGAGDLDFKPPICPECAEDEFEALE